MELALVAGVAEIRGCEGYSGFARTVERASSMITARPSLRSLTTSTSQPSLPLVTDLSLIRLKPPKSVGVKYLKSTTSAKLKLWNIIFPGLFTSQKYLGGV